MTALMDFGWRDDGEGTMLFGRIEDTNPETGETVVLLDCTGVNELWFPEIWSSLTPSQQQKVLSLVGSRILYMLAGLEE